VDTLTIEKPIPYEKEIVREVSVPIKVPTPSDTVVITRVDSVFIEVPVKIDRIVYRDSLYRAVVTGAVVGNIHPMLESMVVYSTKKTQIVEPKIPIMQPYVSSFIGNYVIGVGAGIEIRNRYAIGLDCIHYNGRNDFAIRFTYKFNNKKDEDYLQQMDSL
jgi:hypothetical protein